MVALLCLVAAAQAQTPAQKLLLLSGGARAGLLDLVPGASPAFGLTRLRRSYAGAAVNVRRASDNAQKDIGFLPSGALNVAAATAFASGGTLFVTTWYDESGSGLNATQATAGNQPTLVVSGAHAYINFPNDGSTTTIYLTHSSPNLVQPYTLVFNYNNQTVAGIGNRAWANNTINVDTQFNATTQKFGVAAGTFLSSAASYANVWVAGQGVMNGASGVVRTNGVEATGNVGTTAMGTGFWNLGEAQSPSAANAMIGFVDTAVMFNSGLTLAQRQLVETWLQTRAN